MRFLPVVSFLFGIQITLNQFFLIRKLGFLLGHTGGALSAVLSASFLGMALGALGGKPRGGPWSRDTMGACRKAQWVSTAVGILVAAALAWEGDSLFLPFSGWSPSLAGCFTWVGALGLLAFPAFLQGKVFARLADASSTGPAAAGRKGLFRFYAALALGNLAGAPAYLFLLPRYGDLAVVGTLLIGGLAGVALTRGDVAAERTGPPLAPRSSAATVANAPGTAALFLAGAAAMIAELSWLRSLSLVMGSTASSRIFAVTTVLGWFSAGTLAAMGVFAKRRGTAKDWVFVLWGIMVGVGFYAFAMNRIPYWLVRGCPRFFDGPVVSGLFQMILTSALVGVPAFFMGMIFPAAVETLTSGDSGRIGRPANIFAVTTLGNAAGAAAAIFCLLPGGGPRGALAAALGLYGVAVGLLALGGGPGGRWALATVVVFCLSATGLRGVDDPVVLSGAYFYAPLYRSFRSHSEFSNALRVNRVLFDREGFESRVTVVEYPSKVRSLRVDGRGEAADRGETDTFRMLAFLPVWFSPAPPKSALVVGLGSGVTVGALTRMEFMERVDAVDIEPTVRDAAPFFSDGNGRYWEDKRFHLIGQDARRFLSRPGSQFDIVSSQPSPVWVSGAGSLFTREAFESVRRRLSDRGVYCQWLNAYGLETGDLKTLVATFRSVFPHAALFSADAPHLLLVGSRDPLPPLPPAWWADRDPGAARAELESVGAESLPKALEAVSFLDEDSLARFAKGGEIYSDARPFLEFKSVRSLHRGLAIDALSELRGYQRRK